MAVRLPAGPDLRRSVVALAVWLLLLAAFAAALARPAPLLVNLGAGDEPFARGFRGGWERDGLQGSGETQFRWTLDGARLELPLRARAARAHARLRVARFTSTPADITLLLGERVVAQWRQPPRGWRVDDVELGEVHGPLVLRFRSRSTGGDEMGVALDWVELGGIDAIRPGAGVISGLLAFLLGVPVLAGLAARRVLASLCAGVLVAGLAAVAVTLDRFGGLLALARAGPPLLVVLTLLATLAWALGRAWPEQLRDWRQAALVPSALVLIALAALSHPFFHYPDVDTHARFVEAIRQDATLALDPSEYQQRTGAWTREVGGRRIAFPYSSVFHLLAWPLAVVWDEVTALKALAALAAGLTVLLAHVLARAVGLGAPAARLAQALVALLPVVASRLTLALYPALLGQCLEALLIAHLMRRLGHLEGARDSAVAFAFLLLAQLSYTGSLLNAAALVAALAIAEVLRAEWRRAARLLGAWALSLGLVVAVLYARFLPVLWQQVLPHVHQVPSEAPVARGPLQLAGLALSRLGVFYDVVLPVLTGIGLVALRAAERRARRVLACALVAGAALLALRFTAPALFRDAKEVELLAAPVAVCAAAALDALWRRRRAFAALAVGLGAAAMLWSAARSVGLYAARFLAVGR